MSIYLRMSTVPQAVIISDFIKLNSMSDLILCIFLLIIIWFYLCTDACCSWAEDAYRNFITYIPPDAPYHDQNYYCFDCSDFTNNNGANNRNGIRTFQTVDNTTTYWVHYVVRHDGSDVYLGGYNKNTCFDAYGVVDEFFITESSYDDCKKIRDQQ